MTRTEQGPTSAPSRYTESEHGDGLHGCGSPPPLNPRVVTVRCVFACPAAVVESFDPWAAHEAMEAHYRDAHAEVIAGWAS